MSPPLAGGDRGEGDMIICRINNYFSPPSSSSPVKGEEKNGISGWTLAKIVQVVEIVKVVKLFGER
jgi:hypothetical protein